MSFTVPLQNCDASVAARVGGKARGLHFLLHQNLPVPEGFAVTTDAYLASVAGLEAQITAIAAAAKTPTECQAASEQIRALFHANIMVPEAVSDITAAYLALGEGPVAVRSSATAEDTAEASFAGQQDTYLHITGADAVLRHVVSCWASLFTAQAIGYRARFNIPLGGLAMAVVVQRMVAAEAAGVMMSLDPMNGAADTIYIESALGFGEGVVRGDVGCDRYWVAKDTLALTKQEINSKQTAHKFDAAENEVRIVAVAEADQNASALLPEEVTKLAAMARQAETAFGAPVDMEWAVGLSAAGTRTVFLLQARPETVWAAKRQAPVVDDWDNLHRASAPEIYWSTSNFGEAVPGVATPLSWSFWGPALETAMRGGVYAIGGFDATEKALPANREDWFAGAFFGRPAMNIRFLATVGDRMPGTSGRAVVRDLMGNVPEDMAFSPTKKRYASIAWRLPYAFITLPRQVAEAAAAANAYWAENVRAVPAMDQAETLQVMRQTVQKFRDTLVLQTTLLMGSISPLYDALAGLVKKTGIGDTGALSGFGGAEMDVVGDIFSAARGGIGLDEVVRRHGFHGPLEGELSSVVWREDPSPLAALLAGYAARGDEADPQLAVEDRRKQAAAVAQALLAALPAWQRLAVRMLLGLAAKRIPMRGIPKRSFLQYFDVLRVCARRLGTLLAAEGKLDSPDDIFYLTDDELFGRWPEDAKALVLKRRKRRAEYMKLGVPTEWQGMPEPIRAKYEGTGTEVVLTGIGVSPGIVEGRARVLLSPDFAQVEPGEILVSPTTDPSWSSVMFISAGLVVDIGGALSHAAIVARELGLPCVVNTRHGSQVLQTGDVLRVDGVAGTVEILERASPALTEAVPA
jgi:pyruvate,water dikinase